MPVKKKKIAKANKKSLKRLPHQELATIIILSDGRTWGELKNSSITVVTNDQLLELRQGGDPAALKEVLDISLHETYYKGK